MEEDLFVCTCRSPGTARGRLRNACYQSVLPSTQVNPSTSECRFGGTWQRSISRICTRHYRRLSPQIPQQTSPRLNQHLGRPRQSHVIRQKSGSDVSQTLNQRTVIGGGGMWRMGHWLVKDSEDHPVFQGPQQTTSLSLKSRCSRALLHPHTLSIRRHSVDTSQRSTLAFSSPSPSPPKSTVTSRARKTAHG